jgi:hypothetical protein
MLITLQPVCMLVSSDWTSMNDFCTHAISHWSPTSLVLIPIVSLWWPITVARSPSKLKEFQLNPHWTSRQSRSNPIWFLLASYLFRNISSGSGFLSHEGCQSCTLLALVWESFSRMILAQQKAWLQWPTLISALSIAAHICSKLYMLWKLRDLARRCLRASCQAISVPPLVKHLHWLVSLPFFPFLQFELSPFWPDPGWWQRFPPLCRECGRALDVPQNHGNLFVSLQLPESPCSGSCGQTCIRTLASFTACLHVSGFL